MHAHGIMFIYCFYNFLLLFFETKDNTSRFLSKHFPCPFKELFSCNAAYIKLLLIVVHSIMLHYMKRCLPVTWYSTSKNGSFLIFSQELQVPPKLQEICHLNLEYISQFIYVSGFSLMLFQFMTASYLSKFKRVGSKSITKQFGVFFSMVI